MRLICFLVLIVILPSVSFAQPSNDDFANAIDVTGDINGCSPDAAYTTASGTPDLVAASTWNTSPDNNVWFSFTAPASGVITATVERGGVKGTVRRAMIAIWQVDGTTEINSNRYVNDNDNVSTTAFGLTPGNTYYISVDNRVGAFQGTFSLCLSDQADYDFYEGAIDINGLIGGCSSDAAYTTLGATSDGAAGSCWNTSPDYNRWFTFNGTSTQNIKITISRGASGTIRRINAALWEADGTTPVACSQYISDYDDVIVEVVGGLTDGAQYYLSIDNNYANYRGSFSLCLDDNDVSYDFYEGALDINSLINGCSADAAYTTYGATSDGAAGSCWNTSPDYNRWFTFNGTSTQNMKITISRGASGTIRRINAALWEADGTTPVACSRYISDYDDVIIEVVGGLTDGAQYYLSVDNNYANYRGSFSICMDDNDISYDFYEGALDINSLINGCSADAAYTTYGATGDGSAGSCWNTSPDYNRWFTFNGTSTQNMKITISRGASGTIRRINAALWEADGTTPVACSRYISDYDDVIIEVVGGLTDGAQYYLSVDNNYANYRGSFSICMEDNDVSYDFYEGALDINSLINGCSADAAYTTYGATGDGSAGSCWNTSPDFNRWFTFNGTSTQNMKITISRGASGTIRRINAALWEADGTTEVTCSKYISDYDDIIIEVVGGLTDGAQYYLSVDNNYPNYRGSFSICMEDNDVSYDFYEGAIELPDINNWCSSNGEYTTYGATADKAAGSCWNTFPNFNRWFKFTATSVFVNVTVSTGGSLGTSRRLNLALWDDDGITEIACNRYISDYDQVSLSATTLTPGNTYYISVDNNYANYRGTFTLCVNDEADYDYYEGALELTDLNSWCSADAEYTTSGATADKSAASCWNTSPNYNRWFKFTAVSSDVTINVLTGGVSGTVRRLNVALFESDGITQVACQRYSSDYDDISIVSSALTPGNTYYISVDNNYANYRGTFTLCIDNIDETYYSITSGAWNNGNNWSFDSHVGVAAGSYPQLGDVANIEGHTMTITTTETIAAMSLNAATNNTGLTISSGNLTIAGQFTITNPGNNFNSTLTVANSTLTVNDDFTINRNGGTAIISGTISNSTVNVNHDFTINSTAGTGNNTLSISTLSNVSIGENLTLSNSGGPNTSISVDNSDLTIDENLIYTATGDGQVSLTLSTASDLYLGNSITRGTPAYGVLTSSGNSVIHYNSSNNLQTMASSNGSGTGDVITYENVIINNTRITTPQITLGGPVSIPGTLTLTDGEVLTTATNLLTIESGASISGGSIASFIDGPIMKVGNTDFEFPVGDNNFWQPISIANLTGDAATEFTAQYLDEAHPDINSLKSSDPNGNLYNVSGREYWTLDNSGTASSADVTLHWKDQSRSQIDNSADLQIAHYTGTEWENLGQDAISFTDPGSITVNGVSSFSPLTFGSMSDMDNPLPIELISFNAKEDEESKRVILTWITASEVNNDYFEIERSTDGVNFNSIGQVSGAGTSSETNQYSFNDNRPIYGRSYYRLKQVDFNGDMELSEIVKVDFGSNKFSLFPNPVTNGTFTLAMEGIGNTTIQITIMNLAGVVIHSERHDYSTPESNKEITLNVSSLPSGLYILKVKSDQTNYTERISILE